MDARQLEALTVQLIRHEGLRLKPYRCTAGRLTIGVGRNLDDVGITRDEALSLLEHDIARCEAELQARIPALYNNLNPVRQNVLLNMCFNLGVTGLLGFKQTLKFIAAGDFERAANGMLASKWAKQVGARAIELSQQMRKGS